MQTVDRNAVLLSNCLYLFELIESNSELGSFAGSYHIRVMPGAVIRINPNTCGLTGIRFRKHPETFEVTEVDQCTDTLREVHFCIGHVVR